MIFHAGLQTSPVIVSKDSDVFFILVYALIQNQSTYNWFQMIEEKQFVNIQKICDNLEHDTCCALPQFHAITGHDQTSYKFNTGKTRTFNMLKNDSSVFKLILQPSEDMQNVLLFVQNVFYGGTSNETYVDTRARLYKKKEIWIISPPPPPFQLTQIQCTKK